MTSLVDKNSMLMKVSQEVRGNLVLKVRLVVMVKVKVLRKLRLRTTIHV